eukprot:CAMPEP_0171248546 /NCGR_PEP_ID=MMETSP0790-20130122/49077_1 /TAXON_ID=2925 /ORGANISM="Alexandrium catenella, Strain OF101" /LENGTH=45 /DNA_ID= /DNA_START= /DNA_END= /DNA_ORIENTATION=
MAKKDAGARKVQKREPPGDSRPAAGRCNPRCWQALAAAAAAASLL